MLEEITVMANQLKKVEEEFKNIFVVFLSYKDNNDQADTFEINLEVLVNDIPCIEKSIKKLAGELEKIDELLQQGVCNNINYEESYFDSDSKEYEAILVKH
jgi:hypothetical protein